MDWRYLALMGAFWALGWFLASWRWARRAPVLVQRARVLTEREIRAALNVDVNDPLWVAVHQLIEQQIEAATEEMADSDTQLRPPLPSFYAGGVNALGRLQGFLISERDRAVNEVEEAE